MFESIQSDDAAARFRSAAIAPFLAFLLALLYFSLYPLLTRVPAALFWSVVAMLFAGSILGATAIVRELRRQSPRGSAIGWLVAAILIELLCARTCLGLVFPWL